MKIIAIEKEIKKAQPEQSRSLLKSEALKVWELVQESIIREIYFREDRSEAVLMLECRDIEEAEKVLSQLPLVREGLITFDLIPLQPYPGFSRLFDSDIMED